MRTDPNQNKCSQIKAMAASLENEFEPNSMTFNHRNFSAASLSIMDSSFDGSNSDDDRCDDNDDSDPPNWNGKTEMIVGENVTD